MPEAATTLPDRVLLRLAGDDPRGFLQGLVTHDTALLAPGTPLWAGLLSPQGKALFDFMMWAEGGDVLLECEACARDALARRLSLYRLRRAITIAPDETLAVHWSASGTHGTPDPRLAALGRRWLAPPAEPATGWHEHRLRLGVTEGIAELGSDKTLWLEANARELTGVSFTKGCFIGQENTARMHYRGKINRRLMVAPLGEPGERTRTTYPELGLMVEHRRIEAAGNALMPDWLAAAIAG